MASPITRRQQQQRQRLCCCSGSERTMAKLAHCTKNLLFQNASRVNLLPIIRHGTAFAKMLKTKEYFDADRLEDGSTVQAVMDNLAVRGFCRPVRSYTPPEDLEQRLTAIFQKFLPQANLSELKKVSLIQPVKVQILLSCVQELNHDIPNYELARMHNLRDVLRYFSTQVDGRNPYERLVQSKNLPENLHVIPEGIRFHPEHDTMFGGVSAYPGTDGPVTGLRAKKKYVSFRVNPKWPFEVRSTLGK